jgi:hypothetical protein
MSTDILMLRHLIQAAILHNGKLQTNADYSAAADRVSDMLYRGGHLAAPYDAMQLPSAQTTVLFDDRPQNQRIAEAEERMRNPAPLQFPDEEEDAHWDGPTAQPEAPAEPIDPENDPLFVAGRLEDWAGSFAARGPLTQWLLKGAALLRRLATPAPVAPQPAELTDAQIDKLAVDWADAPAAVRQLGDGRTAEFWSISRHRLYCLIRSAIKAQGGSQ